VELSFVEGIVTRGYGVAGAGAEGTIARQLPFFKALGLDLSHCYPGTLNVSIEPGIALFVRPRHTFRWVRWSPTVPPEDFSFSPCLLRFDGRDHEAYVYYPHPETKRAHFHPASLLEILAPRVPGITYDARVGLGLNPQELVVVDWRGAPSAR
jgi:hypothetical protein